jgi:hypothetical protein
MPSQNDASQAPEDFFAVVENQLNAVRVALDATTALQFDLVLGYLELARQDLENLNTGHVPGLNEMLFRIDHRAADVAALQDQALQRLKDAWSPVLGWQGLMARADRPSPSTDEQPHTAEGADG